MEVTQIYVQKNKPTKNHLRRPPLFFALIFLEKTRFIPLLKPTKNVIQCGNPLEVITNGLRDLTRSFSFLEVWSQHRILTLQPDDDDIDATP